VLKEEAKRFLSETTGTVVTWERLGRLLGYKYPDGEYARKQAEQMGTSLKEHLSMVFHKFLSGEVNGKRAAIYVNNEKVQPWDPFSRGEPHTKKLEQILIPIGYNGNIFNLKLQPYILPTQSMYSSNKAHLSASGPNKWNKQQGLYIYRSGRIIQAGGWCGLRTSDEHTKLARIAMFIPPQLDDLFQVNVAKKHLNLPRDFRARLLEEIAPILQQAQHTYREKVADGSSDHLRGYTFNEDEVIKNFLSKAQNKMKDKSRELNLEGVLNEIINISNAKERVVLFKAFKRYIAL
jgi:hypothetical protein